MVICVDPSRFSQSEAQFLSEDVVTLSGRKFVALSDFSILIHKNVMKICAFCVCLRFARASGKPCEIHVKHTTLESPSA